MMAKEIHNKCDAVVAKEIHSECDKVRDFLNT